MTEPCDDLTTRHVRAAVADHRDSIDWIVRRFTPILEAQAHMRISGTPLDHSEAADIVAESWLITLPRLSDIAPRAGRLTPVLLAFLATTIRSLCNRRIENFFKRRTRPVDNACLVAHAPRPADDNLSRRVREALDALGEPSRTIVLLRAVEGLDNAAVAAELGEPPNTVSHRYVRAIQRLRTTLPDSIFEDLDDD